MEECKNCLYFSKYGFCICRDSDKWYACPIENKKPENIKALKKHAEWVEMVMNKPKMVLYSGDGYADGYMVFDMAECPKCGYEYEDGDKDWGLSFCPNCGQPLKWEIDEN